MDINRLISNPIIIRAFFACAALEFVFTASLQYQYVNMLIMYIIIKREIMTDDFVTLEEPVLYCGQGDYASALLVYCIVPLRVLQRMY